MEDLVTDPQPHDRRATADRPITLDGPVRAPRPVVLVVVRDDPRTDRALAAATRRGLADGARVVLYLVDAAPSALESPLPTAWSGDGAEDAVPPMLGPEMLRTSGQAGLATRVQALADAGIDAYGWLPAGSKPDELAAYARRISATEIIVTAGLDLETDVREALGVPPPAPD